MKTKIIRKEFNIKVKDLGEGVIEAIVASDKEDRHGEVLAMDGLDVKKYMKNPVVAWGHRYDFPSIGQTISIKKEGGKLIAKMKFAIDEFPFANQIYKLYKGGFMRAFSIGFIPKEMDGNKYTKAEMIEYSAVLVPANAEALMLAKGYGIDTDIIEHFIDKKFDGEKDNEKLNSLESRIEKLEKGSVAKTAQPKTIKKAVPSYLQIMRSVNSKLIKKV